MEGEDSNCCVSVKGSTDEEYGVPEAKVQEWESTVECDTHSKLEASGLPLGGNQSTSTVAQYQYVLNQPGILPDSSTKLLAPRNLKYHWLPKSSLLELGTSSNEHQHDTAKDESTQYPDMEPLLPIPRNLQAHSWVPRSSPRLELGTSGYSYEGDTAESQMHGVGRLNMGDKQFIVGIWDMNLLSELSMCQLTIPSEKQNAKAHTVSIVQRKSDYLLTVYEDDLYIAKVTLSSTRELDFTATLKKLRKSIFNKIRVQKVIADESKDKRQEALDTLKELLKQMVCQGKSIERACNFFILRGLSENKLNLNTIKQRKDVPKNVKDAVAEFLERENRYLKNVSLFLKEEGSDHRVNLQKIASEIYHDEIRAHRKMLISECPRNLPKLENAINERLNDRRISFVTKEDVNEFNSIANHQCFEYYKTFFNGVVESFVQFLIINVHGEIDPSDVLPIVSPVYVFLVKSFWEIVQKVKDNACGCDFGDMLKWEGGKWTLNDNIHWSTNEALERISLASQYRMIFDMMEYFSPGYRILSKNKPKYSFKVLQHFPVSGSDALKGIPIDRLVWLYIFDHTVHGIFKEKCNKVKVGFLRPFESLFQKVISAIKNEEEDRHEKFRVFVLIILELLTHMLPFFARSSSNSCKIIETDVEILFCRVYNFCGYGWGPSVLEDHIIDYNRYFSMRRYIFSRDATGYLDDQIIQMKQKFENILFASMAKNVSGEIWMTFFRYLNDFLCNLKALDFHAKWYVKSEFMDMANNTHLERVENKLAGINCTFLVTDVEKYVEDLRCLRSRDPPHHYFILLVSRLLECIEACLSKQWSSANMDLDTAQIVCTGVLLDAVARSFMYLDDQKDFVDFEVFLKESTYPFIHLVNNCNIVDEFKPRCNTVKESFWFIRKMDAIDVNLALTLFEQENGREPLELRDPYKVFKEQFDRYIIKYLPILSSNNDVSNALNALITEEIGRPSSCHFSKWPETTKNKNIPILLAGVSAVWSILTSKDLFGSGKMLKPHCVQILCIMRLLSIDLSKGAENHLAQVKTGQGKSVILGLLSAVLALTGHKVKVLCYSKYLKSRDYEDFEEFFRVLGIAGSVSYDTFEDMANGFLNPICDGSPTKLRSLLKDRVLHDKWPSLGSVTTESEDTVLLIDEVDVFFTDRFYGNSYESCTTVPLDGLELLQVEIWRLVTAQRGQDDIFQQSKAFIERESLLESFLQNPNVLPLLEKDDNGEGIISVKKYTRSSLFDKHLRDMVSDAVCVFNSSDKNTNYRANFKLLDGTIRAKRYDGIYSEKWYVRYLNTFNYFKLKGSDYDHQNGKNYGYLCFRTGQISYARLPSQFKHILGVSGTLKDLSEYDISAIKSYKIDKISYFPSFFRGSYLKFDPKKNFHCFKKQHIWLREIHESATHIVQDERAVLIFFETDWKMELFEKEYKNKYDRFNKITDNTDAATRDKYIEESGLLRAVTLATRGMGRGVDYKSSMVVEAKGGVHVIQTFFSVDIKEEIQIRGRTARQDHKGTYELIVCKEHLFKNEELPIPYYDLSPHYDGLDISRKALWTEKGKKICGKILNCDSNHAVTMKYYGLT